VFWEWNSTIIDSHGYRSVFDGCLIKIGPKGRNQALSETDAGFAPVISGHLEIFSRIRSKRVSCLNAVARFAFDQKVCSASEFLRFDSDIQTPFTENQAVTSDGGGVTVIAALHYSQHAKACLQQTYCTRLKTKVPAKLTYELYRAGQQTSGFELSSQN